MVLNRIFEFCEGCDTDIDVPDWDDLDYCDACHDGPFCRKCKPKHKINADHWKLECIPKPRKRRKNDSTVR